MQMGLGESLICVSPLGLDLEERLSAVPSFATPRCTHGECWPRRILNAASADALSQFPAEIRQQENPLNFAIAISPCVQSTWVRKAMC
jgi:hypothetical protein